MYLPVTPETIQQILAPDKYCFLPEVPPEYCSWSLPRDISQDFYKRLISSFEDDVISTGSIFKTQVKELISEIKTKSISDIKTRYTGIIVADVKEQFILRFEFLRNINKLLNRLEEPILQPFQTYIQPMLVLLKKWFKEYHSQFEFELSKEKLDEMCQPLFEHNEYYNFETEQYYIPILLQKIKDLSVFQKISNIDFSNQPFPMSNDRIKHLTLAHFIQKNPQILFMEEMQDHSINDIEFFCSPDKNIPIYQDILCLITTNYPNEKDENKRVKMIELFLIQHIASVHHPSIRHYLYSFVENKLTLSKCINKIIQYFIVSESVRECQISVSRICEFIFIMNAMFVKQQVFVAWVKYLYHYLLGIEYSCFISMGCRNLCKKDDDISTYNIFLQRAGGFTSKRKQKRKQKKKTQKRKSKRNRKVFQ